VISDEVRASRLAGRAVCRRCRSRAGDRGDHDEDDDRGTSR
jgi:hypothetical protein